MELGPLCVMLLLIGLLHCTQTVGNHQNSGSENNDSDSSTDSADDDKQQENNGAEKPVTTKQDSHTESAGEQLNNKNEDPLENNPAPHTDSEKPKLTVSVNPQSSIYTGDIVTLSCNLQSTGWKFLWYKDNQTSNPLYPEANSNMHTVTLSNEGQAIYYCEALKENKSEFSNPTTITVKARPKPVVKVQPAKNVYIGEKVTLTCDIQTEGSWQYHWYRNNKELGDTKGMKNYTIMSIKTDDEGPYSCNGTQSSDPKYTQISEAVKLNVSERPKPVVEVQPAEIVFSGETVTLTCDIKTRGSWTYHWYRNDKVLSDVSREKTYTITDVQASHEDSYSCHGTQASDPEYTKSSDAVTLTVSGKPKPTVSVNPQSSIYTGDSVTLSCNLQSTGWRFLWYKDNQISNPLYPEANANTRNVTLFNEGETIYYCKARRGNYESESSASATITVKARPKPVVKVQPAENVFIGGKVTLTCEIRTGESWKYHWYRNNKELREENQIYTITDVKESDKGPYQCNGRQSSDPKYTEISDAVTLNVSEKPKLELTSNIKGDALTGNSVTLYCTLKPQSAGWKFYWIKDTQSRETETEPSATPSPSSYTIRSVSVSDGGQYRCRAEKGNPVYYTHYSDALSLNVIESHKPVVKIQPDTQVFRNEKVTFRCEFQKEIVSQWIYDWYKDNTLDPKQTAQEFSIHFTDSYRGEYTCRGRRRSDNQSLKMSDPVILSVLEKPKPKLTSDLKGDVLTGNSVILYCTLKPQSAGWKFYWNKNTQGRETETETETHSYTIRSVSVFDGGQYRCRAGRGNPVYYTHYSDALSLKFIESPKPVMKIQPDTQVFRGESVTFSCEIQRGGDTEWTYDWYKYNTQSSYNTEQEFSIGSVTDSYTGKYTCRGRRRGDNQLSKMSDPVTLTVSEKPKPTVSVNPQRSIYTGDIVTLSCNVQSTGWTFLWYDYYSKLHPFSPEALNTSTFSVTVSNEGQTTYYYCKARRGNYESEFSAPTTITVNARPKPDVKIEPTENVFIGETVTFTCDIQTGGNWEYDWRYRRRYDWKYQWLKNNKEVSEVAEKNYIISKVKASDKGSYSCKGTQSSDPQYTETSVAVPLTVSEKPKPELTSDLKGPALTGNSVTLYCTLNLQSKSSWKFYWSKGRQSHETETHSYIIRSGSVSNGGQYKCRAGRGNPVYYTRYSDALWVNITESPKPVVIIKPDTQVFRGESVTFRCEIQRGRDTEWIYDWYWNGNTIYPYQSTQEISISSVTDYYRWKYSCSGDAVTIRNQRQVILLHSLYQKNPNQL